MTLTLVHPAKTTFRLRTGASIIFMTVVLSTLVSGLAQAATQVTVAWDPNSDGLTAGYYVYYGTESRNYTGSVDVRNATSAVMSAADSTATYYFAVQAYSSSGERSQLSSEVVWKPDTAIGQAPTLVNPGSRTTVTGQSVMVQLSARDPGGLALRYTASGLPPGLSVASATGLISGIPATAGAYNVTAAVTNTAGLSASQTFTWSILAPAAPGNATPAPGNATPAPGNATPAPGNATPAPGNGSGGGGGAAPAPGNGLIDPTDPSAPPLPIEDLIPPSLSITSPTSESTYTTTAAKIIVTGAAWDNVGVVSVTWSNSRGDAGTAFGSISWATTGIDLKIGTNVLTISATDAAGNSNTITLTVTRSVDLQDYLN